MKKGLGTQRWPPMANRPTRVEKPNWICMARGVASGAQHWVTSILEDKFDGNGVMQALSGARPRGVCLHVSRQSSCMNIILQKGYE